MTSSPLTPVQRKFILHWGEMGARWGINRSVAQIHALLFLSERPLTAEQIADALSIARSNVSNSLRELQGWGIVKVAHVMGDRRDHFETLGDVWEMFRIISEERKRREIDPTIAALRECLAEAGKTKTDSEFTKKRIEGMLSFMESFSACYEEVRALPAAGLAKFVRMGGKVRKILGL